MKIIDRLLGREESSDIDQTMKEAADLDEERDDVIDDLQEELQQARQRVKELQQQEGARTGEIEEQLQEERQQRQRLQNQLQKIQQQMDQDDGSVTSVSTPAPDTKHLKGLPVFSIKGGKNFGRFEELISERGKIGIKCSHPKEDGFRKVGYADSLNELIISPSTASEKDAVMAKIDQNGEPVDIAPPSRIQELQSRLQTKDSKVDRVRAENNELKKQVNQLQNTTQKLLTSLSMAQVESNIGDGQKDLAMSQMANQMEEDKMRISNLTDKADRRRGRTNEIMNEYENIQDERTQNGIGVDETKQTIQEAQEVLSRLGGLMDETYGNRDMETMEQYERAKNGGGGDDVIIEEDQ